MSKTCPPSLSLYSHSDSLSLSLSVSLSQTFSSLFRIHLKIQLKHTQQPLLISRPSRPPLSLSLSLSLSVSVTLKHTHLWPYAHCNATLARSAILSETHCSKPSQNGRSGRLLVFLQRRGKVRENESRHFL